jgi:hypothetical protein
MTLMATKAAFAALGIDPRDEAEDAEGDAAEEAPSSIEAKPNARPKSFRNKEPKAPARTANRHDSSRCCAG